MRKKFLLVMGLIGAMLLSGCGGKSSNMAAKDEGYRGFDIVTESANDGYYYSKSEAMMDAAEAPSLSFGNTSNGSGYDGGETGQTELYNTESEKLIRTVTMSLQTKEFETLLSYLDAKVTELGGYVQNSQIYGNSMDAYGYRSASMTLRIPQNKLDLFVSGVGENATVVRKSENAENVTLQYADTEARLTALKIEQERFLALLEKADSVDSIIAIEEHLTELRYEIESHASILKVYDNKVSYSTVTLDISEVNRITPVEQNPTLLTRMKDGFTDSWYRLKDSMGDFLVWVVTNSIVLIIWAVVIIAAVLFVKKKIAKRKMKNSAANISLSGQTDEEQNDGMDFKE
ncbi:MAG: DUF4349 domain-containing protein [Lachnospiraceae bacterium]|nr:DUF4349 domain-containing protein [Lachnospiraceae bacterium]